MLYSSWQSINAFDRSKCNGSDSREVFNFSLLTTDVVGSWWIIP